MTPPNSFYKFPKVQRSGVLWTLVLFGVLHLGILFLSEWQSKLDQSLVLDEKTQQLVDSLKSNTSDAIAKKDTIYPFNPNYITDFKAYQLGISMEVVHSIRAYRASHKYIQTIQDFQQVTGLPDEDVLRIRPYLKLPTPRVFKKALKKQPKKELNAAKVADLQKVYGIGQVFAQRIVDFRNQLDGFLVADQLGDVWGLKHETQQRVWEHFKLDSIPEVKKQNINHMTIAQLSELPYISASLASRIVATRTQQDSLTTWDDLAAIEQLDSIKKARLSLYLLFN